MQCALCGSGVLPWMVQLGRHPWRGARQEGPGPSLSFSAAMAMAAGLGWADFFFNKVFLLWIFAASTVLQIVMNDGYAPVLCIGNNGVFSTSFHCRNFYKVIYVAKVLPQYR